MSLGTFDDATFDSGTFDDPLAGEPSSPPSSRVTLNALRHQVIDILNSIPEVEAADWQVLGQPVEAAQPPCFLVDWGPDPWRSPASNCYDTAQLEVIVIVPRLIEHATYSILEAMVDAACDALATNGMRSPSTLGPGPFQLGNVSYLAARVQVRQLVQVGP